MRRDLKEKESVSQLMKRDSFMFFLDFLVENGFHTVESQPTS